MGASQFKKLCIKSPMVSLEMRPHARSRAVLPGDLSRANKALNSGSIDLLKMLPQKLVPLWIQTPFLASRSLQLGLFTGGRSRRIGRININDRNFTSSFLLSVIVGI
jgi:hypothetical protein